MVPTECNIPDLSQILAQSTHHSWLMHQLIGAESFFPEKMGSYRRNMVRLSDKAVHDYMDVRQYVLAIIADMQSTSSDPNKAARAIFLSQCITNRLEDCIITVRRLFSYFERVKSDKSGFPLNRLLKRQIENLENSIRKIRDLIMHLDGDISDDKIGQGESTAPSFDAATKIISMAGVKLPITDLAKAIQHFHTFSSDFARYRLTKDGRYEIMAESGPLRVD